MKDHQYKNLSAYFSASSEKLAERKSLYLTITESIASLGVKLTYNWLLDKERLKPDAVFEQALSGIKKADIVVAEITYPSIGVGQQIALALNMKTPVLALYQKNSPHISRFALGMKSPYLTLKRYDKDNLMDILRENFYKTASKQFVKFNFISTKEINGYLARESSSLSMSKSQLLRSIIRDWMSKEKSRV